MKRAWCLLRPTPYYRRDAFVQGLKRAGYRHEERDCSAAADGDVVVMWNLQGIHEQLAKQVSRQGAIVMVAENGYLGSDEDGKQHYALAVGGHNGSGRSPPGCMTRLERLKIELSDWKTKGHGMLICGQRGIGSRQMASPLRWEQSAMQFVTSTWRKPGHIRPHPGNIQQKHLAHPSLVQQLRTCEAVVVWSSRCGIEALVRGVPVYYAAPSWICAEGALPFPQVSCEPLRDDIARVHALAKAASAQWTVKELETGEPFMRLRDLT
jgi:hypothetical protein